LEPEVIAVAIEAYRVERQRLSREAAEGRNSVERELADTKRRIGQLIRAIEDGGDTKMLAPRLNDLSARQQDLEARLVLANSSDVVELHPQVGVHYAGQGG
jgi:site-specific DNA recombinase